MILREPEGRMEAAEERGPNRGDHTSNKARAASLGDKLVTPAPEPPSTDWRVSSPIVPKVEKHANAHVALNFLGFEMKIDTDRAEAGHEIADEAREVDGGKTE